MTTMPIYALTDTWNAASTTFTGIQLNVTDTASAAGSMLIDLQVGGASRFNVNKNGSGIFSANTFAPNFLASSGVSLNANAAVLRFGAAEDIILARDAADTLAQRRDTNAQTHRWYRSFTDTSNYSRVYLGWSSSTAILATEGAGTGARGNIAFGTAALATSATVGYVMIPSSNGAPTGVPADIPTGQVALHYDTANNKIYVYNGGWVSTAALT